MTAHCVNVLTAHAQGGLSGLKSADAGLAEGREMGTGRICYMQKTAWSVPKRKSVRMVYKICGGI